MQVIPNWHQAMNVKTIETQFGYKFDGPGFYLTKKDTVLITPLTPKGANTAETIWHQRQPEGTIYLVCVYNAPLHETIWGARQPVPTRIDKRLD